MQNRAERKTKGVRTEHGSAGRRILTGVGILVLALGIVLAVRYLLPTSERMNSYTYFGVDEGTDRVLVITDGVRSVDEGIYLDGQLYLPQDYVQKNVNCRFYYDTESQAVLYTNDQTTFQFQPGRTTYQDSQGNSYQSDYAVAQEEDGTLYLSFSYVAGLTDCTWQTRQDPDRLLIVTSHAEQTCTSVKSSAQIRYRAGIKSPILETADSSEKLLVLETDGSWTKVQTESGFTGYTETKKLNTAYTETPAHTYADSYQNISRNHRIVLGWFQVSNLDANVNLTTDLTNVQNLNVLSPTWYEVSDEKGNMTDYVQRTIVDSMHEQGMEVWPLVSDMTTGLDEKQLLSSSSARNHLIEHLITDALIYKYDGLNVDFEHVTEESSFDYLQFIRELSVRCQQEGLVLSVDNYIPTSSNSYYNLKEQASYADYLVLMNYDEHYYGSDAGSVSSIGFVSRNIANALKQVSADRLINGMPFYTRIWTNTNGTLTSKAVTMQAAMDEASAYGGQPVWDEESGQYVVTYQKDGADCSIWLEEERSISEKLGAADQAGLAGVACWRLGQERAEVWDAISSYAQQK